MDQVRLEVRDAFRSLEQTEASYEIQKSSLSLAERRVESASLLLRFGRATTRDVLEARDALFDAQNALMQALVDNYNARLDLFLAMGALRIDDSGLWTETVGGAPAEPAMPSPASEFKETASASN
jgi:outer membrane protein TolC